MSVNEKIKKCLQEGKGGGERHKGVRAILLNKELIDRHVNKAVHNLKAMLFFQEHGFGDWAISAGFYTLYHLLLALLAKEGLESRNQSCTFAFIEKMIEEGKVSLTKEELREIYDTEINLEESTTFLDLRERYQYNTLTEMEREEWEEFKTRIKQLFDKLRRDVES